MKVEYYFFEDTTPGNCQSLDRRDGELEELPDVGDTVEIDGFEWRVDSVKTPIKAELSLTKVGPTKAFVDL